MSERPNHENSGSDPRDGYETPAGGASAGDSQQSSSGYGYESPSYGSSGYEAPGYEAPGYQSAGYGTQGYAAGEPYGREPAEVYGAPGQAGDPYAAPALAQRGPATAQAQTQAQTAMILGIVGVVVTIVGVILGPIALSQAGKAERGGADATAGRVLGWISTILGGLLALFFVAYIVFVIVMITVVANSGY
ncbi:hypothetical protein [Rothia halotolerans]|uniref:hypothetical protein n=1 Tax=Rothia halotolerans TaxID=405770 RepID=UPI00101D18DF|nr:hypothetical protein [Rothia halotolerans]